MDFAMTARSPFKHCRSHGNGRTTDDDVCESGIMTMQTAITS
jgi:hypothetical protein